MATRAISLAFTNRGFGVMTRDVVHPHAVVVKVIEHGHAELVALAVVGLTAAGAASVRPRAHLIDALHGARRPPHAVVGHLPASPKVALPSVGHEVHSELRFAGVVQRDGAHADRAAVTVGAVAAREAPAADFPGGEIVTTAELVEAVVGAGSAASTATAASASAVVAGRSAVSTAVTEAEKALSEDGGSEKQANEQQLHRWTDRDLLEQEGQRRPKIYITGNNRPWLSRSALLAR